PRKGLLALLGVSACIQVSAMFFADGPFNSDNFGYRFIFGVLTFFLFGYAYSKRDDSFFARMAQFIWLVYAALLLVVAPTFHMLRHPHVMELLLGAVLAWPLTATALANTATKNGLTQADNILGRL